jgi:predicted O-methyltransferase YrrM
MDDARCKAIGVALRRVLFGEPASGTRPRIEQIEALRARLERSRDPVSIALPYASARERHRPVGEVCRRRSKRPLWGRLLHELVRELSPASVLEMGTCVGISTAYQAAALELNHRGIMISLEGAPALAQLAAENLAALGLHRVRVRDGLFRDTLPAALSDLAPLDFAFIDGHHDEAATLAYFEQILPCLSPTATLVFDDIAWSEGMARAWDALQRDARAGATVDLSSVGICLPGATPREAVRFASLTRIQAADLMPRIMAAAGSVVPAGATVLVVSRGDDALLDLEGRRAWHFPQMPDGTYAGHHPADSPAAIAELERLRHRGARYLVVPRTAFWWLDYYADFTQHLEHHGRCLRRGGECAVYELAESA